MAKKRKSAKSADPSTTVELRVPQELYNLVQELRATHPEVIEETLKLIFHRDEVYGMTAVKITNANAITAKGKAAKEDEEEIFKVCEG